MKNLKWFYLAVIVNSDPNSIVAAYGKMYGNRPGTQVFFFGGHQFPTSSNPEINGIRLYMNAVMSPSDRGQTCPSLDICSSITCEKPTHSCSYQNISCNDNNGKSNHLLKF